MPRPPASPLALFLAAFFAVWTLRATVLFPLDAAVGWWGYGAAWKVGAWLLPAWAYAAWVSVRPAGEALAVATRPQRLGEAAAVTGAAAALAAASAVAVGGAPPEALAVGAAAYLGAAGRAAVSVVCEEALFRGLVLGELRERGPFGWANGVQAGLFTLAHVPNWLWVRGADPALGLDVAWVLGAGLLFGWLVGRTGSLWPAVAAHLAVNAVLGVAYAG